MKTPVSASIMTDSVLQNTEEASLSLDAMGLMLTNLSRMYQDPTSAVIREYTANMLDIHRAQGVQRAATIMLPSAEDPTLRFINYGVGLDAQALRDMLTYGKSTKRDTNDQLGAAGLGSKSGLAIADSVQYESIKDGKYNSGFLLRVGDSVRTTFSDEMDASLIEHPSGINDFATCISIPVTYSEYSDLPQKCMKTIIATSPNEVEILRFDKDSSSYQAIERKSLETYPILDLQARDEPLSNNGPYCVKLGDMRLYCGFSLQHKIYVNHTGVLYPITSKTVRDAVSDLEFQKQWTYIIDMPVGSLEIPQHRDYILDTPENDAVIIETITAGKEILIRRIEEGIERHGVLAYLAPSYDNEDQFRDFVLVSHMLTLKDIYKYTITEEQMGHTWHNPLVPWYRIWVSGGITNTFNTDWLRVQSFYWNSGYWRKASTEPGILLLIPEKYQHHFFDGTPQQWPENQASWATKQSEISYRDEDIDDYESLNPYLKRVIQPWLKRMHPDEQVWIMHQEHWENPQGLNRQIFDITEDKFKAVLTYEDFLQEIQTLTEPRVGVRLKLTTEKEEIPKTKTAKTETTAMSKFGKKQTVMRVQYRRDFDSHTLYPEDKDEDFSSLTDLQKYALPTGAAINNKRIVDLLQSIDYEKTSTMVLANPYDVVRFDTLDMLVTNYPDVQRFIILDNINCNGMLEILQTEDCTKAMLDNGLITIINNDHYNFGYRSIDAVTLAHLKSLYSKDELLAFDNVFKNLVDKVHEDIRSGGSELLEHVKKQSSAVDVSAWISGALHIINQYAQNPFITQMCANIDEHGTIEVKHQYYQNVLMAALWLMEDQPRESDRAARQRMDTYLGHTTQFKDKIEHSDTDELVRIKILVKVINEQRHESDKIHERLVKVILG